MMVKFSIIDSPKRPDSPDIVLPLNPQFVGNSIKLNDLYEYVTHHGVVRWARLTPPNVAGSTRFYRSNDLKFQNTSSSPILILVLSYHVVNISYFHV